MDICVQIENRANAIAEAHPDWPCRKGCDHCCRHLAAIPLLTAAEWDRMCDAVLRLPREVHERIRNVKSDRPVTCPLLHPATGSCLVYHHRPIACRAYGFYVEKSQGLYCENILDKVESGEYADVVWGNWEAVEPQGEQKSLRQWFTEADQTRRS